MELMNFVLNKFIKYYVEMCSRSSSGGCTTILLCTRIRERERERERERDTRVYYHMYITKVTQAKPSHYTSIFESVLSGVTVKTSRVDDSHTHTHTHTHTPPLYVLTNVNIRNQSHVVRCAAFMITYKKQ